MIWIRSFHSHVPCNIISMSCSNFHSSLSFSLSHALTPSRTHPSTYSKRVAQGPHRYFCLLHVYIVYCLLFFPPPSFISCLSVHSLSHSLNHFISISILFICSFRRFDGSRRTRSKTLPSKTWGKYEEPLITVQVTSFLYENFYFLMTLMAMIKMWL